MRRVSNVIDHEEQMDNALANLDDVTAEGFRKRYMEKVKDGTLPDDNRTVAEIQMEEDAIKLKEFAIWCGIEDEVDVNTDNPMDILTKISQEMTEGSKEALELAAQQRERNDEEDAAEKIKQITQFTVNTDDPLNINEFKEKKERIIQGLLAISEKAERQKENENTYQESYSKDTSNRFQSRSGYDSGYTHNMKSDYFTKNSTRKAKIIDVEDEDERKRIYYDNLDDDVKMAKQFAMDGGGYYSKNDSPPNYKKIFAAGKFRFKNLWGNVKKWFKTRQARVIVKFGIAITFEMAMAMLAGKREFEGNGQMLAYLGMIMGAFIISNELMKEGFDPRKVGFN